MKRLFAVVVFLVTLTSRSQAVSPLEKPYIEVTGTAEKQVTPDIIFITITLKDKMVNRNTYTISAQDEKLKKGLKGIGIDLKNLFLSDASSDVLIYKNKEKGMQESVEYILQVSSAASVSQVFEMLHNNNIKEAFISKTDHSQIEAFRKEVRIDAIKAAKDKATYLLEAVGEKLGEALIITENRSFGSFIPQNRSNSISTNSNGEADEDEPYFTDFKKLKIEFSYYVKYSIK